MRTKNNSLLILFGYLRYLLPKRIQEEGFGFGSYANDWGNVTIAGAAKMDSNTTNNILNETNATSTGSPPGQTLTIKISLIVIAVLVLIGNGLVIYLIATRRHLRTKTNLLVASLAVSDLVVGLTIIPSFLACMYVDCDTVLTKLFYDAFLFVSVCNLCCITFDRFMAITQPLKYHMTMTRKIVVVMVVVSWILPTVVSLIPATWLYTDTSPEAVVLNNKIFYTLQVVVFMFFPCLIMLVAYAVILKIAWKQSKHIRTVLSNLNQTRNTTASSIPSATTTEAKATLKVFGTVVIMFVVCWSLSAYRSIVVYYDLMTIPFDLTMTSRMLLVSNSAIDPIIYSLWKRDIKMEIRKLLKLNKQMVRPTSATLRSSQMFGDDAGMKNNVNGKLSRVGSKQDVAPNTTVKDLDRPMNGIVNVAMAEDFDKSDQEKTDNKLEELTLPQQATPLTLKYGTINMVAEVDGYV